eukprot:TRINITY_DN4690_c0_g1_i1.p1 TRINITY_DN4690_c0_g1~~TRINITY_DN4690_c0_g1_i1.p1  ORF type:complete len:549 (+),score=100.70 TRINITY_DN4690_c0_g1_i1:160-1806(+)
MGAPCESSGSISDFNELNLLGEGAYSAVYKVQRLADGQIYAMKKVKMPSLSDKEKQNALNEIRLLASVRHDNVISYKEAFFDDRTRCLCIVTECADGGDLMAQITRNQKKKTHLKETDAWRYFLGLCCGLQALHSIRILHRDMKPANVFLHGSVVKLGDFNVSTVNKRGLCMTQTGTPYYASPEVWRDMPYDAKSDIWSLGCVMYEVLALEPPFQAKDMEGLYRSVLRGKYPAIPDCYSKELSEVISVCLQVNPRHRPSAEQLLQLPIVRRKASELGLDEAENHATCSDLLGTIKVPRNIMNLQAHLPRPQYNDAPSSAAPTVRSSKSVGRIGDTVCHSSRRGEQDSAREGRDRHSKSSARGSPRGSDSVDACVRKGRDRPPKSSSRDSPPGGDSLDACLRKGRDRPPKSSAGDSPPGGDSLDACLRKAEATPTPSLLPPLVDMLAPEQRPARGGRHGAGSQPPPRRRRSREGRRERSRRREGSIGGGNGSDGQSDAGGGGSGARERRYVASLSPYTEGTESRQKHSAGADAVPRLPRILTTPAGLLV